MELISHAELYGGLWRTWKELAANSAELSHHFKEKAPVISFGAGDGARDRLLMDALKKAGCECSYFPVDASQAMLEMACAGSEDADIETVGIKADISSPVHLVYAADAAEPPRLFILSGNTMGSFDPLAEIRYVAQCMKPEDRLIVDGEIHDAEQSMARRDNPAARRFMSTLLANVGIAHDDGEIRLNLKRDDRHEGLALGYAIVRCGARLFGYRGGPGDSPAARRAHRHELPVHLYAGRVPLAALRAWRPPHPIGTSESRRALSHRGLQEVGMSL